MGERSLLSDDVTAADVIASTPCELLALSRSDFNVMLGPLKEIIAKEFKKSVIRKVKILDLLSDSEVEALAAACTLVRHQRSQREGRGDVLCISSPCYFTTTNVGNSV